MRRGNGALDRLGIVRTDTPKLRESVDASTTWLRRVHAEGAAWELFPRPSASELWPNASHREDEPWHFAKRQIAERLEELTLVSGVGPRGRREAHQGGVYSWRDLNPGSIPNAVGSPPPRSLQAVLEVNQSTDGTAVRPAHISAAEADWRTVPPLELYVDFETVSDLADDFAGFPMASGRPMLFMIGCGHVERGEWRFRSFMAEDLSLEAEARMIDAWFAHMADVRGRVDPDGDEPPVIHWSPAEAASLSTAYSSAASRHPERAWPVPRWFDFLTRVIRAEPVVVRGALTFGLKAFAGALHTQGCIGAQWDEGPSSGLAAAVGAWWSNQEAQRLGVPIAEIDLMRQIAAYNEADCRVMMEVVGYLRGHH